MKKALKIIFIILLVIVVLLGSLAIWQRKNIESIMVGIKESSEEIEKRRNDNQMDLIGELNSELEMPLRELTEEEKQKVDQGEITVVDVYAEVFAEKELQQSQIKEESKPPSKDQPSHQNKVLPTKDEIISKHMSQLYKYQSEFTAKAEATISQGTDYYLVLRKEQKQDKATARANTITHFTSAVRGVQSECDAKVKVVIENLEKELKEIGANTDIVRTISQAYENEKQLKLSYYANKYLK